MRDTGTDDPRVRVRPNRRGSRPRTKIRPNHEDALTARVYRVVYRPEVFPQNQLADLTHIVVDMQRPVGTRRFTMTQEVHSVDRRLVGSVFDQCCPEAVPHRRCETGAMQQNNRVLVCTH